VSINAHGFLASTFEAAFETAYEPFAATMNRIGRERGWPPMGRGHFEAEAGPAGALVIGSPEQAVEKILAWHRLFRMERFLLQLTVGPMPHEKVLEAIELLGTEVAPAVRREVGAPAVREEAGG
jgi:alkanesulfonate monooxygenase SsuD/methylene tetrahydromethanopterin reductase-like flavin-dependent oxidoreductase (luciferase family)